MKINPIELGRQRNDEYRSFMEEIEMQIKHETVEKLGIIDLFPDFQTKLVTVREAMGVMKSNILSPEVDDADEQRDDCYSAFVIWIRAYLQDKAPAKRQAAEAIMRVIEDLKNPTELGLNTETSVLQNLQTKLAPYTAQLELIRATERFNDLVEANENFIRIQDQRYNLESKKASTNVKAARNQLDPVYKNIVARIDALSIVNGIATYADFVNAHNTVIASYRNTVAQRKGRTKK